MLPLYFPTLLLAIAVCGPSLVQAQKTTLSQTVGCFDPAYVTPDMTELADAYSTADSCAAECYSLNFIYAKYGDSNSPMSCSCFEGNPASSAIMASLDSALTCQTGDATLLVTSTTFYLIRCLEDPRPGGPDVDNLPQIVSSPEACLQQCRYDYEAYLRPHTEDDLYDCRCGNYSPNNATEGNCGRGSTIGLSHEAGSFVRGDPSTPSDYVVKKRNLNRLSRKAVDLCPKGLMAYKLAKEQAGDAFECIDPNQELESCGGCLHGQVGTDSPAFGVGVDCTSLPGVSRGAVTCLDGQCTAFACEHHYSLASNGTCISIWRKGCSFGSVVVGIHGYPSGIFSTLDILGAGCWHWCDYTV